MEAALWAFHNSQDFCEGALLAANLGDDADTTAAIYGQIAGAAYGAAAIPAEWRESLTMASEITSMADSLYDHARQSLARGAAPGPFVMTAEVTERTGEIRGVTVRWIDVIVEGHTVEQVLLYRRGRGRGRAWAAVR